MKRQMVLENKDSVNIVNTGIKEEIADTKCHFDQADNDRVIIKVLNMKQTSTNRILELWNTLNTRIFSIHLTFSGELSGQCIIVIESDMAYALIDMMTNNPAGTTRVLDDAEAAVVGEMGNIIGPLLFNEIVTTCRIALQPNPSIVLYDTAEALHEIAAVEMISDSNPMYTLETTVLSEKNRMDGTFLIMLNPDVISSNLTYTGPLRSRT